MTAFNRLMGVGTVFMLTLHQLPFVWPAEVACRLLSTAHIHSTCRFTAARHDANLMPRRMHKSENVDVLARAAWAAVRRSVYPGGSLFTQHRA